MPSKSNETLPAVIAPDPMTMLRSMLSSAAAPKPRPATWVRALREAYWIGFISILVALLGFGLPSALAGLAIVINSLPSVGLMLAQRLGIISNATAGERLSWLIIGRRVILDAAIVLGVLGMPLLGGVVTAIFLAPLLLGVHRRVWSFVKAREAERIAAHRAAGAHEQTD